MQQHWQEPWGDRRQEIVFIGAITSRFICTDRGHGTQYGISHDDQDPARLCYYPLNITTGP